MIAVRVIVEGRVQGVGFRAWVARRAAGRGLSGFVRNRADGSVEALFAGDDETVRAMVDACRRGPASSAVTRLAEFPETAEGWSGFEVRATL